MRVSQGIKLIVLITKSLKDIGHDRDTPIISNDQSQNRKRVRDKDDGDHETLKTKGARLMTIFALLVKVINRDSNYCNAITNRVPIPVSYKIVINDPIFGS